MNEKLAELYGTNQVADEADTEKLAAAALADGLADEGGIDLDSLTTEQIESLAAEVLNEGTEKTAAEEGQEEEAAEGDEDPEAEEAGEEGEEEAAAEEGAAPAEEPSEETKEKIAEADYMGRVMAHAYVQELKEIEKTAGLKDKAKAFGSKAKEKAKAVGGKVGGAAKKAGGAVKAGAGKVGSHLKNHKGKYGIGAAGLAAAGGGMAAYKHSKKKHASATPALDTLVDARVAEILSANGIEEESEKVASDETVDPAQALAIAVEQRAIAKLQEMGYEFETEEGSEE